MPCGRARPRRRPGGMLFTMEPALNRYYADQKKRAEAMSRYTSWYNITLNVHPVVSGICAAMERDAAEDENFDVSNIQAVKASLMGPLSGVGDAFFWGVLRIIAAGIGIGLAATGSPLGAIAFLLIYNIPSWIVRWGCQVLGFKLGTSFISKVSESGLMGVVTKAAGILGLLMIGAMTASNVAFNVALTFRSRALTPSWSRPTSTRCSRGSSPCSSRSAASSS